MALSSTVRSFELELSDVDRGVYDALSFKVAQHPSESDVWLVARVLAFALEQAEGLVFTAGLAESDQPALWRRDLTGRLHDWIEVGTPSADRLHKASKAASRVAVYCHKRPEPWLRLLRGQAVHKAEDIELFAIDPVALEQIAQGLARRCRWQLTRTEGVVYLDTEPGSHVIAVPRLPWPGPA